MYSIKRIVLLLIISAFVCSCRVICYNFPDISDYKIFPYREVKAFTDSTFYFQRTETVAGLGKEICTCYDCLIPDMITLDEYLEKSKTAAFLIIRNDTLLYEKFGKNYNESSIFNIFSVTKLITTSLVGTAIEDGLIESVDQKIIEYIPELASKEGFDEISIKHLLLHTSGIKFTDGRFNPFSDNTKYYYSRDLRRLLNKTKLIDKPGRKIHYSSVNVQLLAVIVERASGLNLSAYLEEKIWEKTGMQYDAKWSVDNRKHDSLEKGFSNFNCTAIDLAKIGRLYLNEGVYNEEQIVNHQFMLMATARDTANGSCLSFQYSIRFDPMQYDYYYSRGLYGQLLLICPQKNVIIVRLGEKNLKYNPQFLNRVMLQVLEQI